MHVLIVGGGGREHALAWKAAQTVERVFVAPGNAGTDAEPGVENVTIAVDDIPALLNFAREQRIGLTIVGPEQPLVAGLVDAFQAAGLACFGPSRDAAQLEGSKSYSKAFMRRHGIPTAHYEVFTEPGPALAYLRTRDIPIVIKVDGLAAGKGVVVAHDLRVAEAAVRDMLSGQVFGQAGRRILIEDFLTGEEISFIVITDGTHILPLATSQDHKAVGEGDSGANTGGMGAYSPAPLVDASLHRRVMREIIEPTVRGMAKDGHPFTGFLYAGLMVDSDGNPRVLEYNVRFGDPETQPVMMRLQSDLVALCTAALDGRLAQVEAQWDPRACVGVVMAAGGYPGGYQTGHRIEGLSGIAPECKVFHAGTAFNEGLTVTNGGRVLCVCALGENVDEARRTVYAEVEKISWPNCYYRRDIGYRAVARERGRG